VGFRESDQALFGRYFKVVIAGKPPLLQAVYRLRYQVYCVEHSFERAEAYQDQMETDIYDPHSVHAALLHIASGMLFGCVRLVLPGSGALPIWDVVADPQARMCLKRLPQAATAEVSRYAVSKLLRRRSGEREVADAHFFDPQVPDCRRLLPHITIGLMAGVATLSMAHGISHLCAVMAPALLKILRAMGMEFSHAGPVVDHHGVRQPCFAKVSDLLQGVRERNPDYYEYVASCSADMLATINDEVTLGYPQHPWVGDGVSRGWGTAWNADPNVA
jgi:N-acyl amino acid synthase of PEP-CTERM/exosortase system